jgi:hypothetical protein
MLQRTKINISQKIVDEYAGEHGTIESQADGTVKATVMNKDGITVQSEQKFFLCEQPGDEKMCEKNGWTPVKGTAEDLIVTAQTWATDQYRNYVHEHHEPAHAHIHI